MRRYDALARHARAQHADSQIKAFNLGIVSKRGYTAELLRMMPLTISATRAMGMA